VHVAVSEDLFRLVFFQGHPEYDVISLLKEYKREVALYAASRRTDYPPFPENYFPEQIEAILDEHRERVQVALACGAAPPELPEGLVAPQLDNTWHDTAEAVLNNWIGLVYQLTHHDRRRPFKDGIEMDDPLRLRRR
jgi:homoserine O-succinyltransferase